MLQEVEALDRASLASKPVQTNLKSVVAFFGQQQKSNIVLKIKIIMLC